MSALQDYLRQEWDKANRSIRSPGLWESVLWFFAGLLIAGPPMLLFLNCVPYCSTRYTLEIFQADYFEILTALLFVMFPAVFKLIFGQLPFQTLRNLRSRSAQTIERVPNDEHSEDSELALNARDPSSRTPSAMQLAYQYSRASERVAANIYSRSGVYLLIGVLVAFSGLGFFYLRSVASIVAVPPGASTASSSLVEHILALAPNFGILFFIEFIAFFFLRQYRSALDEYRYYEALKRRREENLLILQIIEEKSPKSDAFALLKQVDLYSTAGKLAKDESTELLESKKLQKDEIEIVDKFIDLLGKLRGA